MTQTNKMGEKPILPLLLSMSFPPMLSMLIQSLYNIVDSYFVAQISVEALTAVSFAFPLQNLILAAALGTGIGANSYISRMLGEKQFHKANLAASHAIVLAFFCYILFVLLGLVAIKPFFYLFTKEDVIIQLGCQYTNIIVFFSFGTLIHIAIEKILQATGKMIFPMILQTIGALINIILDPILIFGLFGLPALGVRGAAIATIIGQISSMTLALLIMLVKTHDVKLIIKNFSLDISIIKQIYVVGLPSFLMNALGSILVMGLNTILAGFSNIAVSVFGIYYKLQTFVYMPVSGLIQGVMPIMGYNYGAENSVRLKTVLKDALLITFGIMVFGTVLFWTCAEPLLLFFKAENNMLSIGVPALRIISIGFLPATVGFQLATLFQAMGRGFYSLIIFLLRQLVITLPLAFLLAPFLGLTGVWISFPIAEIFSAIVSFFLYRNVKNKEILLQ